MSSVTDPAQRSAANEGGVFSLPDVRLRDLSVPAVSGVLTIASAAAWGLSLPGIRPDQMNDLGLISVLPPTFFLAIALVTASFVLALRIQPLPRLTLAINVVALIVYLYGTFPAVTEDLSFATAWLHSGFTDAIARTGELYPERDARFSWPAFFAFAAYLVEAGGFGNAVDIAPWSPLVLNLLFLAPLLIIYRSCTNDARLVWLAVWFFFVANWVGQDYFSPQGFNFLLYLGVIAVILTAFRTPPAPIGWISWLQHRLRAVRREETGGVPDDEGSLPAPYAPRTRVGLVLIVVGIFVAIAAGHQLTPFAALGGMLALVLFGRTSLRGLPLIMLVIITTWLSYMTVAFLAGNLAGLIDDIGQTENIAASNVANRIRGSLEHQLVVYVRLLFTFAIWLLAFAGGIRRLLNRHVELTVGLLALSPFGLIGLQGYGGEMLLRVFLFSLPFMAFLAAAAFVPGKASRPIGLRSATVIALVGVVLVGGFLVTRYGNARADYMSPAEAAAGERLYEVAEPGALIAMVNFNAPLRHLEWEAHRYKLLRDEVLTGDVDDVTAELRKGEEPEAYLVLTRSQRAFAQLFLGMEAATWERIEDDLRASPDFDVVYENADALILRLRDAEGGP